MGLIPEGALTYKINYVVLAASMGMPGNLYDFGEDVHARSGYVVSHNAMQSTFLKNPLACLLCN